MTVEDLPDERADGDKDEDEDEDEEVETKEGLDEEDEDDDEEGKEEDEEDEDRFGDEDEDMELLRMLMEEEDGEEDREDEDDQDLSDEMLENSDVEEQEEDSELEADQVKMKMNKPSRKLSENGEDEAKRDTTKTDRTKDNGGLDEATIKRVREALAVGKYVPPQLRRAVEALGTVGDEQNPMKKDTSKDNKEKEEKGSSERKKGMSAFEKHVQERQKMLKRQLRGQLNRLSVENVDAVNKEIRKLIEQTSRGDVSDALVDTIIEFILAQQYVVLIVVSSQCSHSPSAYFYPFSFLY